jgi:hypothetical protein
VEASPLYLEPRARRIESRLVGDRKLVLSAEPSQQSARYKAAGLADVRLWQLPYTTIHHRLALGPEAVSRRLVTFFSFIGFGSGSLYKGRVLHLKGRFFDEKGAIAYYQRARPRSDTLRDEGNKLVPLRANEFVEACKAQGRIVSPDEARQAAKILVGRELSAILQGKVDASYWLGLIDFEQGQYASALDYFDVRTLQYGRMLQGGREVARAPGAHYNIARVYEMTGERAKAILEYRSSGRSADEDGNLLRARWLSDLDGGKEKKPAGKPTQRPAATELDDKPSDPPVEK